MLNQAVEESQGNPSLLAQALIWRAAAHRFKGLYQASIEDTDKTLQLIDQNDSLNNLRSDALRPKGISLFRMGHLKEAIEWQEQALLACADNNALTRATLLFELGISHSLSGYYDQALDYCSQALNHFQRLDNITLQADVQNSIGVVHHVLGDYEQAVDALEKALACARQSGYRRIEALTLASIGDVYTELDATDTALIAHQKARKHADRFLSLYLDISEAALARLQKDWARSRKLLDSAKHLVQNSSSDYEHGLFQMELGKLALSEAHLSTATTCLESATIYFDRGGQQAEAINSHLSLAVAYQAKGADQDTMEQLKHVFHLASGLDNQRPILIAGREAKFLFKKFKNDPIVGQQVTQLQHQIKQFEKNLPAIRRNLRRKVSAIPFGAPKLTIQTLGMAQVMVDDRIISSPHWLKQRRVRELFFYFLNQPKTAELTRSKIGGVFWSDSPENELRVKLGNIIYRIRRALGKDVILFHNESQGYYTFNWEIDYQYDVEDFDKHIAEARSTNSLPEQAGAYRTAVDLYKGPYLPELDSNWIFLERDRLLRAYIEANTKLAQYYLEIGDFEVALEHCHKILTEDRSHEGAHRKAMRAYAALSNQAAIIRQFQDCERALKEEVDAPVSDKTKALLAELII